MDEAAELPDISFFGLIVKGGKTATYRIENEPGLMEICHLTNCALYSTSSSTRPVYVKIKSPDVDGQFVLGALIPGKILSFATDLLITPDTEFCHTGGPDDEVHLTGYRSIDAATLLMSDEEDEDDEADADDEDDADFIDDGAEEGDEEEAEEDDSEEDMSDEDPALLVANGKSAQDTGDQKFQRRVQKLAAKAQKGQTPQAGVDFESSSEEGSDAGEDDDDKEHRDVSDEMEERQEEMIQQLEDEADAMMDEDDDDDSADPSAKTLAIQKANEKKMQIQREKKLQKRQLQADKADTMSLDDPEEAPAKRSKQGSGIKMPEHPGHSKAESRQFAEALFNHLKMHPSGVPIETCSSFRPRGAEKVGKLIAKYSTWFKRVKGQGAQGSKEVVCLADGA